MWATWRLGRDLTLTLPRARRAVDRLGEGGEHDAGGLSDGIELCRREPIDEHTPNRRDVPGGRRVDLLAATLGDDYERAATVGVAPLILHKAASRHSNNMVREPTLLPPEDSSQFEQPHPAVGPVRQRHQHQVVRVRQGRFSSELPGELALDAHVHELE